MNGKKLTKGHDKMLAGVCSGFAEYLDVDVTLIRAVYAIASVMMAGFPGIVLYIILMVIMPDPIDTY